MGIFGSSPLVEEELSSEGEPTEIDWAVIEALGRERLETCLRPALDVVGGRADLEKLLERQLEGSGARLPVYIGRHKGARSPAPGLGKKFHDILQSQAWDVLAEDPASLNLKIVAEVRKLRGKRLLYLASKGDADVPKRAAALIELFNQRILMPAEGVGAETYIEKLRRMLMAVAMERLHHPSQVSRQLGPLTSASDLAGMGREVLIAQLLPQVANILGTEQSHMKGCPRELKERSCNLGGDYESKVAWVENASRCPDRICNGDAEGRLHLYIGRHAGPEIRDCGFGNPFVIGQNPETLLFWRWRSGPGKPEILPRRNIRLQCLHRSLGGLLIFHVFFSIWRYSARQRIELDVVTSL